MQRLGVLKKNHADEQYLARRNLRELPETIDRLSQRLAGLLADRTTAEAHANDLLRVGNGTPAREDALAILGEGLDALPKQVSNTHRYPLGVYHGLKFGLICCSVS